MKHFKKRGLLVIFNSILLISAAHASEWAEKTTISGFSSAIFQISDSDNSFNGVDDSGTSRQGSFSGTRFGLNINSRVNEKVSLASQLLASNERGDYASTIDWAFITFRATDDLMIRTGKVKYPVGISNEYVSVGRAYPWISLPQTFYSIAVQGPQVTRDAYTGASVLWQKYIGDIDYTVDLFGGVVNLGNMTVHELRGVTVSANWDDLLLIQASSYLGKMENTMMMVMDGERHAANVIGAKLDLENIIAYVEYAKVDMGNFKAGNANAWYGSVGYRMKSLLAYTSFGSYSKGKDAINLDMTSAYNKQYMATAGVKYDFLPSTDIKIEVSRIRTSAGRGLFEKSGANANVNLLGVAIDVIF